MINKLDRNNILSWLIPIFFANCVLSLFTSISKFGDFSKYLIVVIFLLLPKKELFKNLFTKKSNYLIFYIIGIYLLNFLFKDNYGSLVGNIGIFICLFSLLILINIDINEEIIERIFKFTLFGLVIYILIFTLGILTSTEFDRMNLYIFGVYMHPNYQTVYLPLFLSLGLFYNKVIKRFNVLEMSVFVVVSMMSAYCVFKMDSRAELLALLATLFLYLIISYKKQLLQMIKKPSVIVVLIIIVIIYLSFSYKGQLPRVIDFPRMLKDGGSGRTTLWQAAIQMNIDKQNLFGLPIGYFQNHSDQYITVKTYLLNMVPHNTFLTFWLESGLFGMISIIGFLFVNLKKQASLFTYPILMFTGFLIPSFFIDNVGNFSFYAPLILWIYSINYYKNKLDNTSKK